MKKTNLNLILTALLSFGLGILVMVSVASKKRSLVSVKDREVIKNVFSSGCEVGILKYCDMKKVQDCRNFCILFVESQPQVIDLLIEGLEKNAP